MPINRRDTQEAVLTRLEVEQHRSMKFDDCHPCASATGHRRGCSNGSSVPMIHMHRRPITYVVHNKRREPFECLTALSFIGPLNHIEGMDDRENVQDKNEMMDGIKDFILDLVSKKGRNANDQ